MTAMVATVVAVTLALTAIALAVPDPAAAQVCRFDYDHHRLGACVYRWVCE